MGRAAAWGGLGATRAVRGWDERRRGLRVCMYVQDFSSPARSPRARHLPLGVAVVSLAAAIPTRPCSEYFFFPLPSTSHYHPPRRHPGRTQHSQGWPTAPPLPLPSRAVGGWPPPRPTTPPPPARRPCVCGPPRRAGGGQPSQTRCRPTPATLTRQSARATAAAASPPPTMPPTRRRPARHGRGWSGCGEGGESRGCTRRPPRLGPPPPRRRRRQ